MTHGWTKMSYAVTVCKLGFIACVLTSNIVVYALAATSWDRQGVVTLKQGDNLTLTCTVPGVDPLDGVRVFHTLLDKRTQNMADNGAVMSPYKTLSRYRVGFDVNNEVGNMTIKYTGIQPEDGGSLSCHKLSEQGKAAVINISVLVPVKEACILQISETGVEKRMKNASEVTLFEGKRLGLGCIVTSEGPAQLPKVWMTVGGKDVTSEFKSWSQSKPIIAESGLVSYMNEVKMTRVYENAQPHFNNKDLRCSATLESYPSTIFVMATIDAEFAPVIKCRQKKYHVTLGQNVTVTCDVQSNPACQMTWSHTDAVKGYDLYNDKSIHIPKEVAAGGDKYEVSLVVIKLQQMHVHSYTLSATNDIGTFAADVILDTAPPSNDNNAAADDPHYAPSGPRNSAMSFSGLHTSMTSLVALVVHALLARWS